MSKFPDFKKDQPNKVSSITLCYDLTQLEKLNNQREELLEQFKDNDRKDKKNES